LTVSPAAFAASSIESCAASMRGRRKALVRIHIEKVNSPLLSDPPLFTGDQSPGRRGYGQSRAEGQCITTTS
jgi:hypothetical protein